MAVHRDLARADDSPPAERDRQRADRYVDEEDPAPVEELADDAAEDRSDGAAGFSLVQIRGMLTAPDIAARRALMAEHRAELDRRIAEIQAAREIVEHCLHCPEDDPARCPDFQRVVQATMDRAPRPDAKACAPAGG